MKREKLSLSTPLSEAELDTAMCLMLRAAKNGQSHILDRKVRDYQDVMAELAWEGKEPTGSMTDAPKRRMEYETDAEGWDTVDAYAPKPSMVTPPYPKDTGRHEIHMCENFHVPLPKDCKSMSEWGKTRNEMDRFKAKNWTYSDMVDLAVQDNAAGQEVNQYLKWIKSRCGTEGGKKIPTKITQGVDLAMFLERMGWTEKGSSRGSTEGFSRKF